MIAPSNTTMGGRDRVLRRDDRGAGRARPRRQLRLSSVRRRSGSPTCDDPRPGAGRRAQDGDAGEGRCGNRRPARGSHRRQRVGLAAVGRGGETKTSDNGGYYARVDLSNPTKPVGMAKHSDQLAQVFRFVRRGAVRVDATGSGTDRQIVAFVNTDGATSWWYARAPGGGVRRARSPGGAVRATVRERRSSASSRWPGGDPRRTGSSSRT